jgi:hypothetical protein
MGRSAVNKWFVCFKEDHLLEDDPQKGRPVVACKEETIPCGWEVICQSREMTDKVTETLDLTWHAMLLCMMTTFAAAWHMSPVAPAVGSDDSCVMVVMVAVSISTVWWCDLVSTCYSDTRIELQVIFAWIYFLPRSFCKYRDCGR